MKNYFKVFAFVFLIALLFSACGRENSPAERETQAGFLPVRLNMPHQAAGEIDRQPLLRSLDELAEIERSGAWIQGMALTESGIRESAGDYAGAVAAAFKELAYAYGRGLIQKNDIEKGLLNLLETKSEQAVIDAANAIFAFFREEWTEAAAGLSLFFDLHEEPDSFGSWMLLVCILEKDGENRRAASAYKAIRARYAQFPEYWYRGARIFDGAVAADFAEKCINSSAQGPFAEECRKILANHSGLKPEDGSSLKTMKEIETVLSQSANTLNPELLDSLLPLISLPDNPYTVYAISAMRALASASTFREYFNRKISVSSGRLKERLSYICRG
ncbi:MAG: hypothetical protein LBI12_01825 [Treponema sp.]|nr:hypothetical protein [Treponema sp.]